MDVLFTCHRAPFPPDKGDRLRAWRHLERLARRAEVDVVVPADSPEEAAAAEVGLRQVCREVVVVPRRRLAALARVGLAWVAGRSLTTGWLADPRVDRAVADLVRRREYDLCWGFSSGIGPVWRAVPARRRIMDLCDLDAFKWAALGRAGRGPRAWVYRLEAARLRPLEAALAEEADAVLLSTPQEAADCRAIARPRRLEVLTNGTPWQALADLAPPSAAPPVIGFLGQMDYPPNVAAAQQLALEVLPLVRREVPEVELHLIGRRPAPGVVALGERAGVRVTGEVADVGEALQRVRVFVAPLDQGRGLPNKIIEAMAAGRATVISSWSSHALCGESGVDYLLADGVAERARVIAELLADPARCDRLGAAGRAYVSREHDWDQVLARLDEIVDSVLEPSPAAETVDA